MLPSAHVSQAPAVTATLDPTVVTAPCPRCTSMMVAVVTPHPITTHMERHTSLCAMCNQTKTYLLPAN
jgi:hypothetical protein